MNKHTLKETIKIKYSNLSKSEKIVADYIIEDKGEIFDLTLLEFSKILNVSEPTIIRFTRNIGLKGFTELKLLAMRDIGKQANNDNFFLHNFDISENDKLEDIPKIIYNKTSKALYDTFSLFEERIYLKTINALKNANIIEIIAVGNSGAIALDFMSKLTRIGISSRYNSDNHLQDLNILGMKKNDVVFAITHSGSTTDLVKSVKLAKENNITTIVLTNFKSAEVTKYADIILYTGDFETSFLSETMTSRISQLMIIDIIYSGLIISDYQKYSKQLEKVNIVVEKKNL